MKNGICPKCQSKEIYLRDDGGLHIRGGAYGVSVLADNRLMKLHTFLCIGCGYMEMYADTKTDDRKAYDRKYIVDRDKEWKKIGNIPQQI
jgi:predicted nucleic-acid-binding Zn-ribbon protein